MNPVRDDEKHNLLMAQGNKSSCRYRKSATAYGSAEQNERVVGYYFFNQIESSVAIIASGASYL